MLLTATVNFRNHHGLASLQEKPPSLCTTSTCSLKGFGSGLGLPAFAAAPA